MVFGFFPAQLVQTLARLGVPDALGDGPLSVDELAARTQTKPDALARLLRAATGLGLVRPTADRGYVLTEGGELLRTGTPGSIGNLAQLFCGDAVWRAWGELEWSVRTGEPAFEKVTGRPAFEHMAADAMLGAIFTEAMAEGTRMAAPGVVATCDLTGRRHARRRRRRQRDAARRLPHRLPGPAGDPVRLAGGRRRRGRRARPARRPLRGRDRRLLRDGSARRRVRGQERDPRLGRPPQRPDPLAGARGHAGPRRAVPGGAGARRRPGRAREPAHDRS